MVLLVPDILLNDINLNSGYLSKYGDKTLKGLFLMPQNKLYIMNTTVAILKNKRFLEDNAPSYNDATKIYNLVDDNIISIKSMSLSMLKSLKYGDDRFNPENYGNTNPLQQLHTLNEQTITEIAKNIVQSPNSVFAGYYHIDIDTNIKTYGEADYDASSYSDGTWHPEHLFTNTYRNRNNAYWKPLEIQFDSDPRRLGYNIDDTPSNSFNNSHIHMQGFGNNMREDFINDNKNLEDIEYGINIYTNKDTPDVETVPDYYYMDDKSYGPGYGPGNKYMSKAYNFTKGGLIPPWQYTGQKRNYDRNDSGSLGTDEDRRVNDSIRTGYNMSALTSKSYY